MINKLKNLIKKSSNHSDYLNKIKQDVKINCIDLGAAEGLLPQWKKLDGVASFFSIEPHKESATKLAKIYQSYLSPDSFCISETGISAEQGKAILYKSNAPTGSSILKADEQMEGCKYFSKDYFFPLVEEEIDVVTLSDFIKSNIKDSELHFIKLDIQGAELAALRGMSEHDFSRLILVESEVAVVSYYQKQTDFAGINEFLTQKDFKLYDLRVARGAHKSNVGRADEIPLNFFNTIPDAKGMNSRVWELDVVYIKDPAIALRNKDKESIIRTIVAFLMYNLFTEAYFLIQEAKEKEVFSIEQEQEYKRVIKEYYEDCYNYFAYKPNWISKILKQIYLKIPFFPGRVWAKYMWVNYPNS